MIVTPADFTAERNIPNTGDAYNGVASNVQAFINKYEPLFLQSVLGATLYASYQTGIVPVTPPIPAMWTNLQTLLKPLIVDYVYYYFVRDQVEYNAGVGIVATATVNATRVSPSRKLWTAWNEMVDNLWAIVNNWDSATYGAYYITYFPFPMSINCTGTPFGSGGIPAMFFKMNGFGL